MALREPFRFAVKLAVEHVSEKLMDFSDKNMRLIKELERIPIEWNRQSALVRTSPGRGIKLDGLRAGLNSDGVDND